MAVAVVDDVGRRRSHTSSLLMMLVLVLLRYLWCRPFGDLTTGNCILIIIDVVFIVDEYSNPSICNEVNGN